MTANVTLCHVFIYFTKTKSKCKKTSTRPDSVALETPLTALIWGFLTSFIHAFLTIHSFHHGRGSQFMWSVWVPKHGALCYGQMTLVSHWGLTVVVCSDFYCAAMFLERRVISLFTVFVVVVFGNFSKSGAVWILWEEWIFSSNLVFLTISDRFQITCRRPYNLSPTDRKERWLLMTSGVFCSPEVVFN